VEVEDYPSRDYLSNSQAKERQFPAKAQSGIRKQLFASLRETFLAFIY
jgi:hypothetical protein